MSKGSTTIFFQVLMLRPLDFKLWIIASVYRSLPLGPLIWMRSRLGPDPKRSFFSLSVLQGIDSMDPSFIASSPVLAIIETNMSFPYSETAARSSLSALGLRGMIRTFFKVGKFAKASTAQATVF